MARRVRIAINANKPWLQGAGVPAGVVTCCKSTLSRSLVPSLMRKAFSRVPPRPAVASIGFDVPKMSRVPVVVTTEIVTELSASLISVGAGSCLLVMRPSGPVCCAKWHRRFAPYRQRHWGRRGRTTTR